MLKLGSAIRVRSLIGGLDKERSERTTQVFKLAPDTFIDSKLAPDTFIDSDTFIDFGVAAEKPDFKSRGGRMEVGSIGSSMIGSIWATQ